MYSADQGKTMPGKSRVSVCPPEVRHRNRILPPSAETLTAQNRILPTSAEATPQHQVRKTIQPAYNATNYCKHNVKDSFTYKHDVAETIFSSMFKFWKEERFCDVVLQAKGGDVVAQMLVLAAYSDDLMAKISIFPRGEVFTIDLKEISKETTQAVVNFAYTNQLNLTEHNVIEIFFCASELQMGMIMSKCEEYINQSIKPSNAVLFFNYATQYGLNNVKQKATVYISKNFSTMPAKDLANIPIEVLLYVMSSDDIAIHSELDVFLAIVSWVDYNRTDRLTLAPKLLKCVRYQFINAEQIVTKIHSVDWLFSTNDCNKWLYQVMRFHALKCSGSNVDKYCTPQRPRCHSAQCTNPTV